MIVGSGKTATDAINIVVLQAEGHAFGLVVDGLSDVEEIASCLRASFAPYRESYTPGAYADTARFIPSNARVPTCSPKSISSD